VVVRTPWSQVHGYTTGSAPVAKSQEIETEPSEEMIQRSKRCLISSGTFHYFSNTMPRTMKVHPGIDLELSWGLGSNIGGTHRDVVDTECRDARLFFTQ
jgi:hypothetical protein